MILKTHLCGVAVAYNEPGETQQKKNNYVLPPGREQGSLYSQQKIKIANACEYLRTYSVHKPYIFVATSPGYTAAANEGGLIKKLTHNLKNGYNAKDYVWVREHTKAGYPHFHFVCDMPDFNFVDLSLYWSGLFGLESRNSIRVGTAPRCSKCKKKHPKKGVVCVCGGFVTSTLYLNKKQMAWYMGKYLSKSLGKNEKGQRLRTFAVSQQLAKASAPKIYTGKYERIKTETKELLTITGVRPVEIGTDARIWRGTEILTDKDLQKKYNWKYTGFANTFKGYPKEWKLKPKPEPKPEIVCPF